MKTTLLLIVGLLLSGRVLGFELTVFDNENKPVEDAVILFTALDRSLAPSEKAAKATMQQVKKQFVPHVLPVAVGTEVSFPNLDNVKHHVYSFSDAKTFELELYDDFQGQPIVFDKPGIVELGCNIHDWMLGYVYVTDADYYFTADATGKISQQIPPGDYTVQIWHPLAQPEDVQQSHQLSVTPDATLELSFKQEFAESLDFSSGFDDY